MEWWSIGFLAGALSVMILGGFGGLIEEWIEKRKKDKQPENLKQKQKERYSKDDVMIVLWEFRRWACKYEQSVLDQLIEDMERIYDNE